MNNIPKNSIQLNFRQAERRDIPLLAQWILDQDCRAQHLLDYPTTIAQVKNQLLKELAITELIFSSKMLFVAELNNTALVGVVFVRAIDWKNKHCVMDMYCPKEVRATDLPPIIKQNAYNYLFQDLQMHKIYHHCLSLHTAQREYFAALKKEPEVILDDYFLSAKNSADLYIYAEYKN